MKIHLFLSWSEIIAWFSYQQVKKSKYSSSDVKSGIFIEDSVVVDCFKDDASWPYFQHFYYREQ
jgi:hypothetical protein